MSTPLHEQHWRKSQARRERDRGRDWNRHLYFSDLDEATHHASFMPGAGMKFVGITEWGWQPRFSKPPHPEAYYLCGRGRVPVLIEPWRKDPGALRASLRAGN